MKSYYWDHLGWAIFQDRFIYNEDYHILGQQCKLYIKKHINRATKPLTVNNLDAIAVKLIEYVRSI